MTDDRHRRKGAAVLIVGEDSKISEIARRLQDLALSSNGDLVPIKSSPIIVNSLLGQHGSNVQQFYDVDLKVPVDVSIEVGRLETFSRRRRKSKWKGSDRKGRR